MTLLLKNANIVDGGGDEPFRGDILIHGDTISAIGAIPGARANVAIDCQGSYVAPGFIDPFATTDHYFDLFRAPSQEHYLESGVTSVIGGHRGVSLAPLLCGDLDALRRFDSGRGVNVGWRTVAEFFASLRGVKPGVNFGTLAGYATVRDAVRSASGANRASEKTLSKQEVEAAQTLLAQALTEGAFGISLERGTLARAEYGVIADLLKHYPGRVLAYAGMPEQVLQKEFTLLAKKHDVRVLLEDVLPPFADKAEYALLERAMQDWHAAGLYVVAPPSEFITIPAACLLPAWMKKEGRAAALRKLRDGWLSGKIAGELPDPNPASVTIVQAPHYTTLTGITLEDFMAHRGIKNAREGLLVLLKITDLAATIHMAHPEPDHLARILTYPNILIGSGASGAYRSHWRNVEIENGFLKLLEEAEERGALSVAEFVARATQTVAQCFGIAGRGMIREGMRADVIGFKNKTLRFVIVNGGAAFRDGALHAAQARSGMPLIAPRPVHAPAPFARVSAHPNAGAHIRATARRART